MGERIKEGQSDGSLLTTPACTAIITAIDQIAPQHEPDRLGRVCDTAPVTRCTIAAERLTTAIAWIRARDERDQIFGADLFFDPTWNMLLDLYVAERRGVVVSVSSLCIAAKVPSTTALRWVSLLEKRGLVARRADVQDRRRSFMSLTEEARAKVETTLDRASASNGKLGIGLLSRLN